MTDKEWLEIEERNDFIEYFMDNFDLVLIYIKEQQSVYFINLIIEDLKKQVERDMRNNKYIIDVEYIVVNDYDDYEIKYEEYHDEKWED